MWISIQTKGYRLPVRRRNVIENYVRRALWRDEPQISGVVLTISRTMVDGEMGYHCRLRINSRALGQVVVNDSGPTVRTATQQAVARARQVVRRRRKKRLSRVRRRGRMGPGMGIAGEREEALALA